jgi:hypothetical protein
MAKRSELAASEPAAIPYIGVAQHTHRRHEVPHPAGLYTVDGRAHERVAELEAALLRVAELSGDRPTVMEIICGVLVDDQA